MKRLLSLAWLATAAASDVCGKVTISNNVPSLIPSGCAPGKTTTVTFTATDDCGNVTRKTSTVTVQDTTAPTLTVPAPITLECNSPGGVKSSDAAVVAWLAQAVASDVCGNVTLTNDVPALIPSACGAGKSTTVTFDAVDNCGNRVKKTSTITVRDTTAPVLTVPAPLALECTGAGGIPAQAHIVERHRHALGGDGADLARRHRLPRRRQGKPVRCRASRRCWAARQCGGRLFRRGRCRAAWSRRGLARCCEAASGDAARAR